jgi:ATP/maltotriose-dependent transcriptional regulator MalT
MGRKGGHSGVLAPGRFPIYLVQALQTISPAFGQTTTALLQSRSQEGVLYALLNDLAEFQCDFALILDSYYAADCPNTAQIIQFLLENRPIHFGSRCWQIGTVLSREFQAAYPGNP